MSIDPSVPAQPIPAFTGTVTRLTDTPLVAADLFPPSAIAGLEPDALANINGPSVLRMPDWAAGKQAALHMYFGHHKGRSLRLAYADQMAGPWAMHPDPVIPLADSLFEPVDPAPDPTLAAPDWVEALGGDYLYAHVASPDVHIDEPNHRIIMYYHGLLRNGDQQTGWRPARTGWISAPRRRCWAPYFRATRLNGVCISVDVEACPAGETAEAGRAAPRIHDGDHLPHMCQAAIPASRDDPGDARSATAISLRMTGGSI